MTEAAQEEVAAVATAAMKVKVAVAEAIAVAVEAEAEVVVPHTRLEDIRKNRQYPTPPIIRK